MTNKGFSLAAWVAYGNGCINNVSGNTPEIQTAFKSDLKKAIAHAGYPNKDEIGIIDEINDFDMSATLSTIPEMVSGYMANEQRAFDIPAPNDNTCAATLKIVEVPETTKTGTITFGTNKGQTYESTVVAHEELKVKNRRDPFKK